MFNRLLIIGCGLLGSSILRAASSKKLSKKIFIYEKSNKNISEVKKLKISCQKISFQWSHLTNIERFSEKKDFLGHTDEALVNLAKRIPKDLNSDEPIFWIALGLGLKIDELRWTIFK